MSVPCGDAGNVKIIIERSLIRLIPEATQAALSYANTQLDPIKAELEEQAISIATVFISTLAFIIIFMLIVFVVWTCYELNTSRNTIIISIIFIIIAVLVGGFIAITLSAATVSTVLQSSIDQLGNLNQTQLGIQVFNTLTGASVQYLKAAGTPCPFA